MISVFAKMITPNVQKMELKVFVVIMIVSLTMHPTHVRLKKKQLVKMIQIVMNHGHAI